MKLGFYLFAEYINMFVSAAVMATLYFGGYDIPFVNEASWGLESWIMSAISFGILMIKIAVILFNLGGPDGPEAVRPFLFNLFNDRAIIGLPNPFRWLLAHLISARRTA